MYRFSAIAPIFVVLASCLVVAGAAVSAETIVASVPLGDDAAKVTEPMNRLLLRDDMATTVNIRPAMTQAAAAPSIPDFSLWYVVGDGGGSGLSATYSLSYTTGQSAVGKGNSSLLELNRGFWQNFATSCCTGKRGNVDMAGIVDVSDLCKLVSYLSGGGDVLACVEEGNVSGAGIVDLADLSALIDYLTGGSYVLPYCP